MSVIHYDFADAEPTEMDECALDQDVKLELQVTKINERIAEAKSRNDADTILRLVGRRQAIEAIQFAYARAAALWRTGRAFAGLVFGEYVQPKA